MNINVYIMYDKKCPPYQAVTSEIYLKQQKVTMLKIGLKMREWCFRKLAPKLLSKGRAISLTPLPPRKCASGTYFLACLGMNGPLPA